MRTIEQAAVAFLRQIANLNSWEDTVRQRCADDDVTDESEIAERIQNEQTDLDYLIGQDEALERLIADARRIVQNAPIAPDPLGEALNSGDGTYRP